MISKVSPSWVQQYNTRKFKLDAHAARAGMTLAEYIATLERALRNWVSDAEVRTRVHESGLLGILRSGRFLPWAASGATGSAMKTPAQRMHTERRMFDLPFDADPDSRPVYGYLEGSREADPLTRWGSIVLGLDDSVRQQGTVVLGDSVDDALMTPAFVPVALTDPTIAAFNLESRETVKALCLADACSYGYAEVQLHGVVLATAIKRVIYTGGAVPRQEALAEMAKVGLVPQTVSGSDPGPRRLSFPSSGSE